MANLEWEIEAILAEAIAGELDATAAAGQILELVRPEPIPLAQLAQLSREEAEVMARIVANRYRRQQGIPPKSLFDNYA